MLYLPAVLIINQVVCLSAFQNANPNAMNNRKTLKGRTHIRQSVPCLSTFDPKSPVCLTSVNAPYRNQAGPGLVKRGGLQHGTGAQAQARSANITV